MPSRPLPRLARRLPWVAALAVVGLDTDACTTLRVTDPNETADQQFLTTVAIDKAVDQLSFAPLRDRKVYVDFSYVSSSTQPSDAQSFLLADIRAKMLLAGVRLKPSKADAEIVAEVRSEGASVNHLEFLLGVPASSVGGIFTGGIAAQTPELSILRTTTQLGFASAAYIAYYKDSGEVVAASGPFVGRTRRADYWFFGYGPRTLGNVPPAEPAPIEGGTVDAKTDDKSNAPKSPQQAQADATKAQADQSEPAKRDDGAK